MRSLGNHVVTKEYSSMFRKHEKNWGKDTEKLKNEINLSEGGRYVYTNLGFIFSHSYYYWNNS